MMDSVTYAERVLPGDERLAGGGDDFLPLRAIKSSSPVAHACGVIGGSLMVA